MKRDQISWFVFWPSGFWNRVWKLLRRRWLMLMRCRSDFLQKLLHRLHIPDQWDGMGLGASRCRSAMPMDRRMCHAIAVYLVKRGIKIQWRLCTVFSECAGLFSEQSNGGYVVRCWLSGHEACLSAVMVHCGIRTIADDHGKCLTRYWEERDAAVVGARFQKPQSRGGLFLAPIIRDLLYWPRLVGDLGEPPHDSFASILAVLLWSHRGSMHSFDGLATSELLQMVCHRRCKAVIYSSVCFVSGLFSSSVKKSSCHRALYSGSDVKILPTLSLRLKLALSDRSDCSSRERVSWT